MDSKIRPLAISNVKFRNPLVLSENVIQKIWCAKQASIDGKGEEFEIKHVTDQGEHILSTAEIAMLNKELSNDTLSFSEAREYTQFVLFILAMKNGSLCRRL